MIDLAATFEKYENEYLKFDRIVKPLHPVRDICAFMLLHSWVPSEKGPMVASAEHDEIYLRTDLKALAAVITEENIQMLVRCGVRLSTQYGCLAMFA
jgi:hypothetical protein